MKAYFCPVGRNDDLRVVHVIAPVSMTDEQFSINSDIAKSVVEFVVDNHPALQQGLCITWNDQKIEIIPGKPGEEVLSGTAE